MDAILLEGLVLALTWPLLLSPPHTALIKAARSDGLAYITTIKDTNVSS